MIVGVKDGNPWGIGSQCLNMGINAELEVERYSVLNWCVNPPSTENLTVPVNTSMSSSRSSIVIHRFFLGVVLLPVGDKEVVGMLQLRVVIVHPSLQDVRSALSASNYFEWSKVAVYVVYPTLSQLLISVWVQILQVGILHGVLVTWFECHLALCRDLGVCLQLWWCRRVTYSCLIRKAERLLLTCWTNQI